MASRESVRTARDSRGWSVRDLADLLGVSPSWVTQVEQGEARLTDDKARSLEQALGLPSGLLTDETQPDRAPTDVTAVGYALLWRGRADLLYGLMHHAPRKSRTRLKRHADEILEAAAVHPAAGAYSSGRVLHQMRDIAANAPMWIRQLVFVELAGVKVDAPLHTRVDRALHRGMMDVVADDLFFDQPEEHRRVVAEQLDQAFRQLKRDWPAWRDLECAGGAMGLLALGQHPDADGLRRLLGDDPVCWLDFSYAGGAWLARTTHKPAGRSSGLRPSVAPLGVGTGAATAGLAAVTPFAGVLGLALAGSAALYSKKRKEKALDNAGPAASAVTTASAIATSLGRHWVRVDAHKLLALYWCFGEIARDGLAEAGLPSRKAAAEMIEAVATEFQKQRVEEEELSGEVENSRNARRQHLADIEDTCHELAVCLGTTKSK